MGDRCRTSFSEKVNLLIFSSVVVGEGVKSLIYQQLEAYLGIFIQRGKGVGSRKSVTSVQMERVKSFPNGTQVFFHSHFLGIPLLVGNVSFLS